MNEKWWWYLARSAGVVTAVVLVGSLVLGVLLATRALRGVDRPAWLLAMHRWTSILTVIGTALHVQSLVADSYVHFGWVEVLVPMGSGWRPGAVTFGVIAMYLLAAVFVSSLAMKRLSKPTWRRIHTLSYLAVWSSLVHGALAGTDATNPVYQAVAWMLTLAR